MMHGDVVFEGWGRCSEQLQCAQGTPTEDVLASIPRTGSTAGGGVGEPPETKTPRPCQLPSSHPRCRPIFGPASVPAQHPVPKKKRHDGIMEITASKKKREGISGVSTGWGPRARSSSPPMSTPIQPPTRQHVYAAGNQHVHSVLGIDIRGARQDGYDDATTLLQSVHHCNRDSQAAYCRGRHGSPATPPWRLCRHEGRELGAQLLHRVRRERRVCGRRAGDG